MGGENIWSWMRVHFCASGKSSTFRRNVFGGTRDERALPESLPLSGGTFFLGCGTRDEKRFVPTCPSFPQKKVPSTGCCSPRMQSRSASQSLASTSQRLRCRGRTQHRPPLSHHPPLQSQKPSPSATSTSCTWRALPLSCSICCGHPDARCNAQIHSWKTR